MMWAPIANNVISIAGPGALPGLVRRRCPGADGCAAFTADPGAAPRRSARPSASSSRCWSCCPYLRAAGFRFRPRFDFRGTGLGHTLRLGVWTVLFVVVNQVAYTVVVRLASGGTAPAACGHRGHAPRDGTGYTVYAAAFLFVMVPHAIVTVSLATAILPRLSAKAADGDLPGLARHAGRHAAHGARRRHPVRAAAARCWRYDAAEGALRLRRDRDDVRPLRAVDDPVRPGHRVLHRPLPDAARLLRPRAATARCSSSSARSPRPTSWWRSSWSQRATAAETSPALVLAYARVVRRRLGGLLRRAASPAGRAARPRTWSGSWSGCWSRPASPTGRRLGSSACALPGRGHDVSHAAGGRPAGRWSAPSTWSCSSRWPGAMRHHARSTTVLDTVAPPVRRGGTTPPRMGQRATGRGQACAEHTRPGDVLADRYRLTDLLTESEGGRFWRAFDSVLAARRRRAHHRLRRRAGPAAARGRADVRHGPRPADAAGARHRRGRRALLRGQRVGLGHQPRHPARRRRSALAAPVAAWIVAEVADTLALAHDARVAHGRLVPENVLIDHDGGGPADRLRRRRRPPRPARRAAPPPTSSTWSGSCTPP